MDVIPDVAEFEWNCKSFVCDFVQIYQCKVEEKGQKEMEELGRPQSVVQFEHWPEPPRKAAP
jgi:hypothetical protein